MQAPPPNPFDTDSAAARYAAGRPYFHPIAVEILRERLGLREPLRLALDVGCGTGLSTVALRAIAERVVGIDLAPGMLAQARREAGTAYVVAAGEAIPLRPECVDLMALSCVFHWLDQPRFFAEARRVLRPGGWLAFIGHGFAGRMAECPAFERWSSEVYLARYPNPPRNTSSWNVEAPEGFALMFKERFEHDLPMDRQHLVDYLLTQSNVIQAVEKGEQTIEDVRAWLAGEVEPYFHEAAGDRAQATCRFRFHGHVMAFARRGNGTADERR